MCCKTFFQSYFPGTLGSSSLHGEWPCTSRFWPLSKSFYAFISRESQSMARCHLKINLILFLEVLSFFFFSPFGIWCCRLIPDVSPSLCESLSQQCRCRCLSLSGRPEHLNPKKLVSTATSELRELKCEGNKNHQRARGEICEPITWKFKIKARICGHLKSTFVSFTFNT